MANPEPRHDPLPGKLRNLRIWCGNPSIAEIADITGRLQQEYQDDSVISRLRPLSKATISAILRGERRVHDWDCLAAYVIACRHHRWEKFKIGGRPDQTVLPRWYDEYYRAYADLEEPIPDVPAPDDPPLACPVYEMPELDGAEPAPAPDSPNLNDAPRITHDERALVAAYGDAGQMLLYEVEVGDETACYRMAVLIAAEYGRVEGVIKLLRYAAGGYHGEAAILLSLRGDLDDPQALARYADAIAESACEPIAGLFRECAHACRNRPAPQ